MFRAIFFYKVYIHTSKKILILRHACGPDFLVENISKSDCSFERICSKERERERERERKRERKSLNFESAISIRLPISRHMLIRGNINIWKTFYRPGEAYTNFPDQRYDMIYRIYSYRNTLRKWKMHFWTSHDNGSGSFTHSFFTVLNVISYYSFF